MKYLLLLLACFAYTFSPAQNIDMTYAKFITGDAPEYSYPSTDDSRWQDVKVPAQWETQGHDNYDGYGWYRFHVVLPESLKNNSFWKDSLRINVGKIDDVYAVYLNGVKIGQLGSFP